MRKPLVYYVQSKNTEKLVSAYGAHLESLPRQDLYTALMVVGAIGEFYTNPIYLNHGSEYGPWQVRDDHNISFSENEEKFLNEILDVMEPKELIGLAMFVTDRLYYLTD